MSLYQIYCSEQSTISISEMAKEASIVDEGNVPAEEQALVSNVPIEAVNETPSCITSERISRKRTLTSSQMESITSERISRKRTLTSSQMERKKRSNSCSDQGSAKKKIFQTHKVDTHCWICHRPRSGQDVICSTCPRVYHGECLRKSHPLINSSCEDCQGKSLGGWKAGTNVGKLELKQLLLFSFQKALNDCKPGQLLNDDSKYCKFLKSWPDTVGKILCQIIDLNILLDKIKNDMYSYKSAAQFFSDIKWMYHNTMILHGVESDITETALRLERNFKIELQDLEACYECYYMKHCGHYVDFFVLVCNKPHDIVWAKLRGCPFWPAKCLRIMNGQADVRFFGTHDRSIIPINHCYRISVKCPNPTAVKRKKFLAAMAELSDYVKNYEMKFEGKFPFSALRTSLDKKLPDQIIRKDYQDNLNDANPAVGSSLPPNVKPIVLCSRLSPSELSKTFNLCTNKPSPASSEPISVCIESEPLTLCVDFSTDDTSKQSAITTESNSSLEIDLPLQFDSDQHNSPTPSPLPVTTSASSKDGLPEQVMNSFSNENPIVKEITKDNIELLENSEACAQSIKENKSLQEKYNELEQRCQKAEEDLRRSQANEQKSREILENIELLENVEETCAQLIKKKESLLEKCKELEQQCQKFDEDFRRRQADEQKSRGIQENTELLENFEEAFAQLINEKESLQEKFNELEQRSKKAEEDVRRRQANEQKSREFQESADRIINILFSTFVSVENNVVEKNTTGIEIIAKQCQIQKDIIHRKDAQIKMLENKQKDMNDLIHRKDAQIKMLENDKKDMNIKLEDLSERRNAEICELKNCLEAKNTEMKNQQEILRATNEKKLKLESLLQVKNAEIQHKNKLLEKSDRESQLRLIEIIKLTDLNLKGTNHRNRNSIGSQTTLRDLPNKPMFTEKDLEAAVEKERIQASRNGNDSSDEDEDSTRLITTTSRRKEIIRVHSIGGVPHHIETATLNHFSVDPPTSSLPPMLSNRTPTFVMGNVQTCVLPPFSSVRGYTSPYPPNPSLGAIRRAAPLYAGSYSMFSAQDARNYPLLSSSTNPTISGLSRQPVATFNRGVSGQPVPTFNRGVSGQPVPTFSRGVSGQPVPTDNRGVSGYGQGGQKRGTWQKK